MANSVSSSGGTPLTASSRRYLWSSGFANAASPKDESKMVEKKGKSPGLFNRIRFQLWGRKEKHVDRADQAALLDAEEEEIDAALRQYSYKELHVATEGFSPKRIIGKGGSGVVYKGILKCDIDDDNARSSSMIDVAVKMIVGGSEHRQRDYISEIKVIGRLRHANLVRLLGYCHEGEHLFLVHEFMANGGLSSHLYGSELPPLRWELRYHKIAAGLASALFFLQNEWKRCVVHRDIKPSNILLDSDFNPKLTDFELARLANDHDSRLDITNVVAGTMGYLAPEFALTGKFSKESDIYAFGVVVLQIACGRRPTYRSEMRRGDLITWVMDLNIKGKILEAADPRLGDAFDKQEMKQLLTLGIMCTRYEPELRLSVGEILKTLKHSTMPPRDLLPKEEMSSIIPPAAQQGMMPYFLSDVEDCTTICFELTSTAAAGLAGGTTVQADTVASATGSSTISELDREPASRASSDYVLTSDPVDVLADQGCQSDALPVLVQDDHQLELEAEAACWDIGIPLVYLSAGDSPMKDHHHPVINGFVCSLHNLLRSEDKSLQFGEVLQSIKIYTSCLVSVGAPLIEWNSVAQQVLRVTKMMDAFPTTAATLSSLRANVNEYAHDVDDYEARSESVNMQLALARREHLALMARIAELEKQIEESEEELSSVKQTTTQRRELHGKLSAILNQYESTLSKLSSFTCA